MGRRLPVRPGHMTKDALNWWQVALRGKSILAIGALTLAFPYAAGLVLESVHGASEGFVFSCLCITASVVAAVAVIAGACLAIAGRWSASASAAFASAAVPTVPGLAFVGHLAAKRFLLSHDHEQWWAYNLWTCWPAFFFGVLGGPCAFFFSFRIAPLGRVPMSAELVRGLLLLGWLASSLLTVAAALEV